MQTENVFRHLEVSEMSRIVYNPHLCITHFIQTNYIQAVVPDSFNLNNVITSASIWGFDGTIKKALPACTIETVIAPTLLGTTKLDFFQEKCQADL